MHSNVKFYQKKKEIYNLILIINNLIISLIIFKINKSFMKHTWFLEKS